MDERQPLLSNGEAVYYEFDDTGKHKIVDFHPKGDAENPLDWPKRYRWFVVLLLAFMAFTVTFTCIGIVPVASEVVIDLEGHKDRSASVLFVTIWELGEAAGPLFIAPLSEVFGRYPVYNACNILFIAAVLMTALSQDVGLIIFARFLNGCAVAANVLNPAIVGDIFPSQSRGAAMSAVMLAPLVGGAIGPTVAGALAEATGWREIMWLALGLAVTAELIFLTLFRETYKVTILQRLAARLRKETGDDSFRSKFDHAEAYSIRSVVISMFRPFWVFSGSLVLQVLSLWGSLVFSFFYILATTLPDMLEDVYGFDSALKGVSFLSFSQ
jgi:MFS family permease